jgi:pimeloyl-ACP methyl ester carboxylesterase
VQVSELSRPDGTRIHFEIQGEEGPAVILATYLSWTPAIYTDLLSDLAADHRVVTYHLRGTGDSSRHGPYDMETDGGDLEAVSETIAGPRLLLATADSSNRATRLAVRRPDLIDMVIALGPPPFSRRWFEGREALLGSSTVIEAFQEMLEHNYRGGVRTLIEATNPQLSEGELRERIDAQVRFCPAEAAVKRVKAWADDDPGEEARELGDRLWIFTAAGLAGAWLPPHEEMVRLIKLALPQAHLFEFPAGSGAISRPHEAAEAMRRVTAPLRAGAEKA